MASRKAVKPLNLLVSPELYRKATIQKLAAQGHTVVVMDEAMEQFDMILSEKAWRMTPDLADTQALVDAAVKACRAVKYRRPKKDELSD